MDEKSLAYSSALVALFKGVVNRDVHTKQWNTVQLQQSQIADYVGKIGLELVVDTADGYAYLKQQNQADDQWDIPRLIPRYQLSYSVSVMLVLLRKQLLEFDSGTNADRLIMSKQELHELLRPYLQDTSNEVKQLRAIEINLGKIKDMGFIRLLDGTEGRFEVLRILRSFVDGQWLGEMDKRLRAYQSYAQDEPIAGESGNEPLTEETGNEPE